MPPAYELAGRHVLLCGSELHRRYAVALSWRSAAASRRTGCMQSEEYVGWWSLARLSQSEGAPSCTVSSPTKLAGPRSARGVGIRRRNRGEAAIGLEVCPCTVHRRRNPKSTARTITRGADGVAVEGVSLVGLPVLGHDSTGPRRRPPTSRTFRRTRQESMSRQVTVPA